MLHPKIRATFGQIVNNPVLMASLQVMNDRFVRTLDSLHNETRLEWPPLVVLINGRE